MPFRSLSFTLPGNRVDALTDALLAAGALSVDVADAHGGTPLEQAAFAEPGAVARPWERSRVNVLFATQADAGEALACACRACAIELPADLAQTDVDDQDWVRLTQAQFQPIRITSRLWVVPTWERAPDPNAINLVLDPGAAFGTGSHPSTRLCLQWLARNIRGGERVLDYGCGSGILAIAALKLGAASARGIDIDPQALVAARANAMQNGVAAEFAAPGGEPAFDADVVAANILANPLIALAPLLAAATRAGGHVVLSGILEDQEREVAAAYAPWYEMAAPVRDEGWIALAGRRRER
ncbi:MAG: 50S ribosomal protein L11 methyltransferase [Betaproteobacteria bacterium]|nr:50S ribosomal protein L11 methyltransferase [Betaproteobacteria bacterium]